MSSDNLLYDNLFTVDILILIIYGYLSLLFLIYYIFPIVALLYYLTTSTCEHDWDKYSRQRVCYLTEVNFLVILTNTFKKNSFIFVSNPNVILYAKLWRNPPSHSLYKPDSFSSALFTPALF